MNTKHFGEFPDTVRFLKKHLPATHPVSVRRVKLKGDASAECTLKSCKDGSKKFLIRIDKRLPNDAAILVLIHEWAHLMVWSLETGEQEEHTIAWALAYKRVYNKYFETEDQKTQD